MREFTAAFCFMNDYVMVGLLPLAISVVHGILTCIRIMRTHSGTKTNGIAKGKLGECQMFNAIFLLVYPWSNASTTNLLFLLRRSIASKI